MSMASVACSTLSEQEPSSATMGGASPEASRRRGAGKWRLLSVAEDEDLERGLARGGSCLQFGTMSSHAVRTSQVRRNTMRSTIVALCACRSALFQCIPGASAVESASVSVPQCGHMKPPEGSGMARTSAP